MCHKRGNDKTSPHLRQQHGKLHPTIFEPSLESRNLVLYHSISFEFISLSMQNSLDDNLGTVVDVPLGQTTDVPIQMPEERPFQSWNVEGDLRQSAFSV